MKTKNFNVQKIISSIYIRSVCSPPSILVNLDASTFVQKVVQKLSVLVKSIAETCFTDQIATYTIHYTISTTPLCMRA